MLFWEKCFLCNNESVNFPQIYSIPWHKTGCRTTFEPVNRHDPPMLTSCRIGCLKGNFSQCTIMFLLISSGLTFHRAAVTYRCTSGPCDITTIGMVFGTTKHTSDHTQLHLSVMLGVVRSEKGLEL